MKHYLLAALLLTGLASCTKTESDPAPTPVPATATLQAKWQLDSIWNSGGTAATLYQKNKLQVYPKGAISAEFTNNQYILYTGTVIDKQWPYTQTGNVITNTSAVAPFNAHTIVKLTTSRLVLTSPSPDAGGQPKQYLTSTASYSR